jgi:hypothetical protein
MDAPSGRMRRAPTVATSTGVPPRPAGQSSIMRRYPSPRGPVSSPQAGGDIRQSDHRCPLCTWGRARARCAPWLALAPALGVVGPPRRAPGRRRVDSIFCRDPRQNPFLGFREKSSAKRLNHGKVSPSSATLRHRSSVGASSSKRTAEWRSSRGSSLPMRTRESRRPAGLPNPWARPAPRGPLKTRRRRFRGRYRCCSIKRLPSACARFAASRSPSAACTIEPFIRMCQERAKASGSRSPASNARLRTTERMFSR